MKRICKIMLMLLFSANVFCIDTPSAEIRISSKTIADQHEIWALDVIFPAEWTPSDASRIGVLESKKIRQITCKKYAHNNKCTITFDKNSLNGEPFIFVEIPICNHTICTIFEKKIIIPHNSQNIKKNEKNYQTPTNRTVSVFLFFGFIGGILLNFMPCVLPVILMKMRSFGSKVGMLGSIAGNYVSFFLFATSIALLKICGEKIGWGMHFQNLGFLQITTIILFFLTLYSFEIITFFPNVKSDHQESRIFWKNFISSIVACIVSIPCTAPFLGTAATFAINGSLIELMGVFLMIATGFSTPYIISLFFRINISQISFVRRAAAFKHIINIGVMITFLWIFWLLSKHLDRYEIIIYVIGFTIIWIWFFKKMRFLGYIFTMALLIFSINCSSKHNLQDNTTDELFRQLKQRSTKQVVLFNITADWCLTCKYNTARVLNNSMMQHCMKKNNVLYLEGNMTKKNDALMDFIHQHKRIGIPFAIVYGPSASEGILLNELHSIDEAINAIKAAS